MRAAISTLLGFSLIGAGPSAAGVQPPSHSPEQEQSFCRQPAPLPQLAAEGIAPDQQWRDGPAEMRSGTISGGTGVDEIVTTARRRDDKDMSASAADISEEPASGAVSTPAPPPPPPVMVAPAKGEGARAMGEAADVAVPSPAAPDGRRHAPSRPQSGMLTAGDHDDLLNPELYADYVRRSGLGQQVSGLPRVDTARLVTVEVRDERGTPMPFVPVELRCSDGNSLTFNTLADGTVAFFPAVDRLSDTVHIRAGQSAWRMVDVPRSAGTGRVGFTLPGQVQRVNKLDLALVVDVTGSMGDELNYLRSELDSIVGNLHRRHPELDIRIGLIFYRDQGDEFVTRTYGFSPDVAKARGRLSQQSANGGGDYEEAMQEALVRAAGQNWRTDAVKSLLLVADAPPHAQDVPLTWLAAEHLRRNRVQIVPVGASGVGDLAEYVMRAMAAATQSRYAFLTDDSGIGNPHAPPAIDCYLVTRLDLLLTRIIDSQVSGRRVEPEARDLIRTVGRYDAGRCILPANFGAGRD